jgi:alpha-tubulin suppressor-like RCC1 family protein
MAMGESFLSITNESKIYTWGWNEHGNLSTGDKIDRYEPFLVEDFAFNQGVTNISVGGAFWIIY